MTATAMKTNGNNLTTIHDRYFDEGDLERSPRQQTNNRKNESQDARVDIDIGDSLTTLSDRYDAEG